MWDEAPDTLAELLDEVGSEHLKACFDTGHSHVFSTLPMETWFQRSGRHIVYIHINDNLGDNDSELSPGQGNIDWQQFDRLVKIYCDDPHVVFEVANLEMVQEAVAYLKANHIYPFS